MDNNNQNDSFKYTYSAKEQTELKKIREKYECREESKLERLRRLDSSATRKAQITAIVLGVIGTLVLGFGMSLAMTELSVILGAYSHMAMLFGIVVGVIGIIIVSLAYPIYSLVLKKERERVAPEIIMLTDELLK